MPTEIAYFTPKTKSGNAKYLDLWNADLFDNESHLTACYNADQIRFRDDKKTWAENFETDNPNGKVQAIFTVKESGYYLVVAKLSSTGSIVSMYIDDDYTSTQYIDQNGEEMPGMATLGAGTHSVTINLGHYFFWQSKNTWFHSITIFKI